VIKNSPQNQQAKSNFRIALPGNQNQVKQQIPEPITAVECRLLYFQILLKAVRSPTAQDIAAAAITKNVSKLSYEPETSEPFSDKQSLS